MRKLLLLAALSAVSVALVSRLALRDAALPAASSDGFPTDDASVSEGGSPSELQPVPSDDREEVQNDRDPGTAEQPGAADDASGPEPATETVENGEAAYADLSLADLEGVGAKLLGELNELAEQGFDELRAAGRFTVVGKAEDRIRVDPANYSMLISIEHDLSSGLAKQYILPEDEYPGAYALKGELEQVNRRIRSMQRTQDRSQ